MTKRSASIKETGKELSPAEWERFDAAVAAARAEHELPAEGDPAREPDNASERDRPRRD